MSDPIVTGKLFGRKCSIKIEIKGATTTVNGVTTKNFMQFEDLRAQFKIVKSLKQEPNTMDLSITNLSKNSRNQMQSKGTQVIVDAGYVGAHAVIFSGNSRTIDHKHEGPDVVSRIQCGDGEILYRTAHSTRSWRKGVAIRQVIKDLFSDLGLPLRGDFTAVLSQSFSNGATQFVKGWAVNGQTVGLLQKLLPSYGLGWSIQDGQIQLIRVDNGSTTDPIYVLNPDTGLLGSPEHGSPDQKGFESGIVKARTLLLPVMRPGQRVRLQTFIDPILKGDYTINRVEFTGDTAGNEWFTDLELRPFGSPFVAT